MIRINSLKISNPLVGRCTRRVFVTRLTSAGMGVIYCSAACGWCRACPPIIPAAPQTRYDVHQRGQFPVSNAALHKTRIAATLWPNFGLPGRGSWPVTPGTRKCAEAGRSPWATPGNARRSSLPVGAYAAAGRRNRHGAVACAARAAGRGSRSASASDGGAVLGDERRGDRLAPDLRPARRTRRPRRYRERPPVPARPRPDRRSRRR